jgi:hypothetical protein
VHVGLDPETADGCRALDSVLADSGWRTTVSMSGRTTIDVKQYRVRGRFDLETTPAGDLSFAFTGTMALGGHREDIVVSYYEDTLRVLDRERGEYYEGEEVENLISEGTGVSWRLTDVLHMVTVRATDCRRYDKVTARANENGDWRIAGRFDGEPFELSARGGRVQDAVWPAVFEGEPNDRLEITYRWDEGGGLDELVLFLRDRRWRIKLVSK